MSITIGLNNLITSDEAIKYLKSKFPDYKIHTFRNDIYLKHLKPTKTERHGNKNILLFDHSTLESYVRYRVELKGKRKLHVVKTIKSPDLMTYAFETYKSKLDVILQVLTKEQLDGHLKNTVDSLYTSIKLRLDDFEAQKASLVEEIQSSLQPKTLNGTHYQSKDTSGSKDGG